MAAQVVVVGVFDGVHLGHQSLLKAAVAEAKKLRLDLVAYSFYPHPRRVLKPDVFLSELEPLSVRLWRLQALGVANTVIQNFDLEFANMRAEDFIKSILLQQLRARLVVVGSAFRFGRRTEGSVDTLREVGQPWGMDVLEVPKLCRSEEKIGSSQIRLSLEKGDIQQARALLGRDVALFGKVVRGYERGHSIGFPTANIQLHTKTALPTGVFSGYLTWEKAYRVPCVINIGVAPTWTDTPIKEVRIEAHCMGQEGLDLYHCEVVLEIHRCLREEKKFVTIDALKEQIKKDCEDARKHLKNYSQHETPLDDYLNYLKISQLQTYK